ncbi:MAG: hypothetical protein AAF226_14800, partial [Verrucomicrobiota bacterium]
ANLVDDFRKALECSKRLGFKDFGRDEVLKIINRHDENWQLITWASRFADTRGPDPFGGGGAPFRIGKNEQLRLFAKHATAANASDLKDPAGEFFMQFAEVTMQVSQMSSLHILSDLESESLEDYWGYTQPTPAPVDSDGAPLFHRIPSSFSNALTDGERWRWALAQAKTKGDSFAKRADMIYADFLAQQFSVSTSGMGFNPDVADDHPLLAWHKLTDDESICKLATGIKKITLPEEHNFIAIYRKHQAHRQLAEIYLRRGQTEKAVEFFTLANHPSRVHEITKNWLRLENTPMQTAGQKATISLLFRNTTSVNFTAHKIDLPKLIEATQKHIKSGPDELNNYLVNFENIGHAISRDKADFIEKKLFAEWQTTLKPNDHHWDTRTEVSTPLADAGAYWVTAKAENGNKVGMLLWISDTIITRRKVDGAEWYYVADALTGQPVSGAKLKLFAFHTEWKQKTRTIQGKKRQVRVPDITVKEASAKTNSKGVAMISAGLFNGRGRSFQRMISTTTDDGRLAFSGYENFWNWRANPKYQLDSGPRNARAFIITDRPAYRPDQA